MSEKFYRKWKTKKSWYVYEACKGWLPDRCLGVVTSKKAERKLIDSYINFNSEIRI